MKGNLITLLILSKRTLALDLTFALWALAADTLRAFDGTVSTTLRRAGTEAQHFVFAREGNQLRIENTTNKLEPINIVDLKANKMMIIYPHNTTFVRVDLNRKPAQQAGMPPLPPGFPMPASMAGSLGPPGVPSMPQMPGTSQPPSPGSRVPGSDVATGKIGPNISPPPGFPTPPPLPSMAQPPAQNFGVPASPVGGPPTAAGGPPALPSQQMPAFPMPPPMPGMFGSAPELKKTDNTKKIQGFDCTLYTISDRMQNFEIWATSDSTLFPFRLIERDFLGRRFGPQMLEETWPEQVRNKSLFPLEAILKMEPGGQERLTFKVEKIDRKEIDPVQADKLFQPPEKYIEIQAPQF